MGKFSLVVTLEGSVGRVTGNLHFFLFCQPLQIEFIPRHPQSNLLQPLPWFKLFMTPSTPTQIITFDF